MASVSRQGKWAVVDDGEKLTAASRICRHQLADLSKGTVDESGCLVCPWHQSKYDLTTGEMVEGPKGFLGYHGPARGYSQLVRAYSKALKLTVRRARRVDGTVVVDE
jgi:nitrite reductase/ring-hydroxylating ferredoxin subunit